MSTFRNIRVLFVIIVATGSPAQSLDLGSASIDYIQAYNTKVLRTAIPLGWKQFCEADVDEGVLAFYPGNNPSDATIQLMTANNETVLLPIKYVSKIHEFGLKASLKTIVYVNAFASDYVYDIRGNLQYMQEARKDYNIIVVDFAHDVLQLYNTVKHNVFVHGYFISKLLSTLALNGIMQENVTLIGHSVGANIAALGATLHAQESGGRNVSALIAIDPAQMCQKEDVYVNPQVTEKVIVIHGENDVFSIPESMGTLDIYPNGYGFKFQPGCNSNMCNHVYPFFLFLDAVTEKTPITAVKCDNWTNFRRGKCDYSSLVSIDFQFENATSGRYYCITQPSHPYDLDESGWTSGLSDHSNRVLRS